MAFTEYATVTVPTLVKKFVPTYFDSDPYFKMLRSTKQIKLVGSQKVRVRLVKDYHSEPTEISDSNITVALGRRNIFDYIEWDWPRLIAPLIWPHEDHERMTSTPGDAALWVKQTTATTLEWMFKNLRKRLYLGTADSRFYGFMTLLGSNTSGTRTGFANGLVVFDTIANQIASGPTWLGRSRRQDTTNDFDNWYNQYKQHSGIGVDFFDAALEAKLLADSFADTEGGGEGEIDIGILSITNHIKLGTEIRNTPSGGAQVLYTIDNIEQGRVVPRVHVVDGVKYFSNRLFNDTTIGKTEPCYLLPSACIDFQVFNGLNFKTTKVFDGLETTNVDADIGYIKLSGQFVPNAPPMRFAGVSQ